MNRIFELIPYFEVITRHIYKYALSHNILKKRIVPNEKAKGTQKVDIKSLDDFLNKMGIESGDTLIVHSSMSGIKGFGMTAEEIVKRLEDRVGSEGTLLMPTYPDYKETGSVLTFDEQDETIYEYDVKNSKSWTGYLTEYFRNMEGTVRSSYPNNTLAARGKNAENIFKGELETDLAFDTNSAWRYCMDHHAKVLFLGIHAHHSISEIHIAEDMMDERWPVKGWYTTKSYKIIDGEHVIDKTCRVRKKFWTKYIVEHNGCLRLRKSGNLIEETIGDIYVSFIPDVYELEQFVEKAAEKGDLIFFKIPRKYMK